MKTLVTNYTFSAAAKQITFTDYPSLKLDQILLITNVTDNIIIYNFADPTAGGTLAGNVLTLGYDTTTMSNTDRLQIFIDDYVVPSTEASLTAVNFNLATFNRQLTGQVLTINQNVSATNTRLQTLINQTDGLEGSLTNIDSDLDTTNSRLQTLINQTDGIENTLTNIQNNTGNIPNASNQQTITVQLSNGLHCGNFYIWSIQGTSFANYDQYLQVRAEDFSLIFTQKIKANENFEFNFWPNGSGQLAGSDNISIHNSLTPFTHTPGNNDLYLFVRGIEF